MELPNPKTRRKEGQIQTSVLISPHHYNLCKTHGIKFSHAVRVGISILLAERGLAEYNNKLNIVRRCNELQKKAATYAQEAADLKNGADSNST